MAHSPNGKRLKGSLSTSPVRRHSLSLRSLGLACVLAVGWLLAFSPSAEADQGFRRWLNELWPEAQKLGVSRSTFSAAFRDITPNRSLPNLLSSNKKKRKKSDQAEFAKPPKSYISERYINSLAIRGQKLSRRWDKTLDVIEANMGVNRSVLLAIWGRETVYGSYKLKHNAIRSIATQAYLGERKDYFRDQLLKALLILEEGHVTRSQMRSSWAGAMGLTQFMPSNYYDHAVDFDGDGKRNIWTSVPDALASTAKSLLDNGWQPGKTWGYEVRPPANFDCSLEGIPNARPLHEWVRLGFARSHGRSFRPNRLNDEAFLVIPEGTHGPAFLALKNYLVIKSYNYADLYVLFVGHLADRIAGGGKFEARWATDNPMRRSDVKDLQQRLNKMGFDVGKVDGRAGMATRVGIGTFQKANGLVTDCFPSRRVLKDLRRASRRQTLN